MSVSGAIYQTALAMDVDERKAFLDWAFRGDPQGLARMNQLLATCGESVAFFMDASQHRGLLAREVLGEEPTHELADRSTPAVHAEEPGTWIGPYYLIARIGEGGCGVVYEAEQQKPMRRRVAVKIIRLGMDTENVIARFELERQALALMQHPNIAQVFDAGATATGRPYFVMERVSGERITVSCDREHLDIEGRIRLFIRVCHAIQHAHQKGVVHRDIKPSNVLVTFPDNVPIPKVIDFGIAKAATATAHQPQWTAHDQIMGTPAYMSPEQVDMSGIDVDTRSDIYSLGALLYELLCGRAPFDEAILVKAGVSEMRRILLEQEPPLPSRVLADLPPEARVSIATARRDEPSRLAARLRGDLDWIVAMAMAKDRGRRYQTVNALAADLERFLSHQPIVAHRPNSLYLLGKFVRRNRLICLAGIAVTLSLVGGLGTSSWLYLNKRTALLEQQRLSREATAANQREAHLRRQTQARANVSRVAVLLSEGKIKEADDLLQKIPLESIEPSREAAAVFRSLGNWYAAYARWDQVVQCFRLLNQANRLDDPVKIVEGTDILAIAAALVEAGDKDAYERFRRDTLDLYLPARNSLQAEHLLKVCLLAPADAEFMARLQDVATVCEASISPDSKYAHYPAWEAFAMALYYSRLGKPSETLKWGETGLGFDDPTGTRIAALRCLTALARFRNGDSEGAERDLRVARLLIPEERETEFLIPKNPPDVRADSGTGTWYSLAMTRTLLRETEHGMNAAK